MNEKTKDLNLSNFDDTLRDTSDKLFHSFIDVAYSSMKGMSEKYGAHVAMSVMLMTAAQFAIHSHLATGMARETILDLMNGVLDDAELEKEVAEH